MKFTIFFDHKRIHELLLPHFYLFPCCGALLLCPGPVRTDTAQQLLAVKGSQWGRLFDKSRTTNRQAKIMAPHPNSLRGSQIVNLSECRSVRVSDCHIMRALGCQWVRLSECHMMKSLGCQSVIVSELQSVGVSLSPVTEAPTLPHTVICVFSTK